MDEQTKSPVPDFAIFQNSRTRISAIWTKPQGRWTECTKDEYDAIDLFATLLRNSPNPKETMKQISKIVNGGL